MTSIILILGLAILAYAFTRAPNRIKLAWSQQFKGWQKLFGFVAVILAVLILINPEFFALGLLGDTAFFDAFVLLLGLQLQVVVARAWYCTRPMFSSITGWVTMPSPSTSYLLAVSALFLRSAVSTIQKTVHRMWS